MAKQNLGGPPTRAGDALTVSTGLTVLVYSGGSYPARPAGAPGGAVRYVGPTQPTTWLANDEWVNNS